MTVQESTYELLGAIADSSIVLGIAQKTIDELNKILETVGVETSAGDYYQRSQIIARKAYGYFAAKAKEANDTAANIKKHFVNNDGTAL